LAEEFLQEQAISKKELENQEKGKGSTGKPPILEGKSSSTSVLLRTGTPMTISSERFINKSFNLEF